MYRIVRQQFDRHLVFTDAIGQRAEFDQDEVGRLADELVSSLERARAEVSHYEAPQVLDVGGLKILFDDAVQIISELSEVIFCIELERMDLPNSRRKNCLSDNIDNVNWQKEGF